MRIAKIRSGGQSGVDQGALDTAKANGISICGWCPKGGWAENYQDPPEVLKLYPELSETPFARVEQRTVWNVRDSDATLIINPRYSGVSRGTELTEKAAKTFGKPLLTVSSEKDADTVVMWIMSQGDGIILNVGGPRESECSDAYDITERLLNRVFAELLESANGKP